MHLEKCLRAPVIKMFLTMLKSMKIKITHTYIHTHIHIYTMFNPQFSYQAVILLLALIYPNILCEYRHTDDFPMGYFST